MPTRAENVRSWRQTGSGWPIVKPTRMTDIGHLAFGQPFPGQRFTPHMARCLFLPACLNCAFSSLLVRIRRVIDSADRLMVSTGISSASPAGGRWYCDHPLKAMSCTAKADFMTTETTFLVQAFSGGKGGHLKASTPVPCRSADGARRTAERLSLSHLGVVAFSVTSDPETGDYDDQPTVFFRAGQLPSEFDTMP
jgi:hypothetical protein